MNENINDLRAILFAELRRLREPDSTPDIERAKAINDIAQTIINSAKAEVEYMRVTGGKGSGFVPELPAPENGSTTVENVPGGRVIRHRLAG